jgi:hypothetical protein
MQEIARMIKRAPHIKVLVSVTNLQLQCATDAVAQLGSVVLFGTAAV